MASFIGTVGDDSLRGSNFDDILDGFDGNDTLNGGAGQDTMTGGLGDDTYWVDNSGDIIIENVGEGTDRVYTSVGLTLDASVMVEEVRLTGSMDADINFVAGHNVNLIGNSGNNVLRAGGKDDFLRGHGGDDDLVGGNGQDILFGDEGNDTLRGGLGDDLMVGGAGDDFYIVRDTTDSVVEHVGDGYDTVLSRVDFTLGQIQEVEVLRAGSGDDLTLVGNDFNNSVLGSSGNDVVRGAGGDDSVRGNGGDDTIDGGAGNDSLVGGAGSDVFEFYEGAGDDRILDFDTASDSILFTGFEAADVSVSLTPTGRNALVEYGDESILVVGIDSSELSDLEDSFVFDSVALLV